MIFQIYRVVLPSPILSSFQRMPILVHIPVSGVFINVQQYSWMMIITAMQCHAIELDPGVQAIDYDILKSSKIKAYPNNAARKGVWSESAE